EAIPVPHLFVEAGWNQIVVLEVAFRGADGLRFQFRVSGGNVIEEWLQVLRSVGLGKGKPEGEEGGEHGSHCLPPHRSVESGGVKFSSMTWERLRPDHDQLGRKSALT